MLYKYKKYLNINDQVFIKVKLLTISLPFYIDLHMTSNTIHLLCSMYLTF